jgi:hypothetical protein
MFYDCLGKNIIPITQGSDYADTVTIKQPDGTPMDLTGYIVESQLRDLSSTKVADFTCEILAPPTDGVIARSLSRFDTTGLVPLHTPNHVWGIRLTAPDGNVLPEIQGGAKVSQVVVQ